MSERRSAAAPPAVTDHNAWAGVKFMSRTATAMQNDMLVVNELPGLQSVASATVTPASSNRLASGHGARVENSAPGSRVATVSGPGERLDVGVGGVGAVVDRRRPELDAELDTAAGAELTGVQSRHQTGRHPGGEDVAGFVDVEGTAIAEHVDPAGVRRARSSMSPTTSSM